MTEKDKELEELEIIIAEGRRLKKSNKGIAVRIQLNDYSKQPFDVEELKAWLEEEHRIFIKWHDETDREKHRWGITGELTFLQMVKDKIKELEEGGC